MNRTIVIPVRIPGRGEWWLTVDEARNLAESIRAAIDDVKEKCPTCRCRIVPGDECACCADGGSDG